MTLLRSLRIKLGHVGVGSLFALDDGRTYFHFDDAYAVDPGRPPLSQLYVADREADTRAQLLNPSIDPNRGPGAGKLPPFFRGLLPEGRLRKHLMAQARLAPDDELGLLAYCGTDLPGNVYALAEKLDQSELGRLVVQGRDSYEMSSEQFPTPEAESISGVQPKVALVEEAGGRYVMRSKNSSGIHFIGKLPASDFPQLPEIEYSSMQLAAAAGATVCQVELKPLSSIADQLPFELRNDARNFLLVRRFDRDASTANGRLHMEDFAQVQGVDPESKYSGTYAELGLALKLRGANGDKDLIELVRRIKLNELLGNFDAHLKNFSLLYEKPNTATLSPSYDIVAYSAYLGGRGHALEFLPGQKSPSSLTPVIVRALSNAWDTPEPLLTRALSQTVDLAMQRWPGMLDDLPVNAAQRSAIWKHVESNVAVKAWNLRSEKRALKRSSGA